MLQLPLFILVRIHTPYFSFAAVYRFCIQMYSVWSDVAAKKFQSMLVWLIVEFLFVQLNAFRSKPSAKFRKQTECVFVQIFWYHHHTIIHK